MTDSATNLPIEEIVDRCLDEIAAGRLTASEALTRWPEHREELAPLLDVAIAMRELPPLPARAPDPDRRAAFMAAIATTPQDDLSPALGARIGSWFSWITGALPRLSAIAAPAAAIALVAVFFVLSNGADRATASTLTLFEGTVERHEDGEWLPLADGAELSEGDQLRTAEDGIALVTFADGSTAALDPGTEVVLERIATGDTRQITIEQLTGRIWNDVAPGGAPATYVVRTVDAVIEAHGTTFETVVSDGATSVVTASGQVEVAAGSDRAMVEPGEVVRAVAQRIVDATPHATSDAPATLRIDGPFVASLRSQSGAATGALPNGVTYQQIPGVSTTNPGDGPQILRFYDIEPGRYDLVLRRIDGRRSAGAATLTTDGHSRTVNLPPDLATMTIRIDIGVDGDIVQLELVDRQPVPANEADGAERIALTPRITDAVPVSDQRAATTALRPDATSDTNNGELAAPEESDRPTSPTATRTPTQVDPVPTVTATPFRDRLLTILGLEPARQPVALRHFLEEFERDDPRWLVLREYLESDGDLRRRFSEALLATDAPELIEFVRNRLGLANETDAAPATNDAPTSTPAPAPADQPDDGGAATSTPTDALRDGR